MERGHAVAIGARRAGDAACAVVECRDAVGVGSGAAGDATGGVVKDAPGVPRVGGKRQEGQEHDGGGGFHDR